MAQSQTTDRSPDGSEYDFVPEVNRNDSGLLKRVSSVVSQNGAGTGSHGSRRGMEHHLATTVNFYTAVIASFKAFDEICTTSSSAKKLVSFKTQCNDWEASLAADVRRLQAAKVALDSSQSPAPGHSSGDSSPATERVALTPDAPLESPAPSTASAAAAIGSGLNPEMLQEMIHPPPVDLAALADYIQTNTFGLPIETQKLRKVGLDLFLLIVPRSMYVLCTLAPVLVLRGPELESLPLPAVTHTLEDAIAAFALCMNLFTAHLNPGATNAASTGSQHLHTDAFIRSVLREATESIKSLAKFSLLVQAAARKSIGMRTPLAAFRKSGAETESESNANGSGDDLQQRNRSSLDGPSSGAQEFSIYDQAFSTGVHIMERAQVLVKVPLRFLFGIVGCASHVGALQPKTRTDCKAVVFQLFEVLTKQTLDFVSCDEPKLTTLAKEFCSTFPPLIFILLAEAAALCGDTTEAELLAVKVLSDSLAVIASDDELSFRLLFATPRFCKPIVEGALLCVVSVHPAVSGAGLTIIENIIRTATLEAAQEVGFVYCNSLLRLLDSENTTPEAKTTILNHLVKIIVPDPTQVSLAALTGSVSANIPPKPPLVLQLYWLFDLNPRLHHINFVEMLVASLSKIVRMGGDGLLEAVPGPWEPTFPYNALNVLIVLLETIADSLVDWCRWRRQVNHAASDRDGHFRRVGDKRDEKNTKQRAVDIVNVTPVKGIFKLFDVSPEMKSCGKAEDFPDPAVYQNTVNNVVEFLLYTPSLNPGSIGEFLGDSAPFCVACAQALMHHLPLKGKRLTEGLSEMLSVMQLPREGQRIERVLEYFAMATFEANRSLPTFPFRTSDATFIVTVATVMLNTDLHNPRVSSKMNLQSFVMMARGCNDGADLPAGYMEDIFHSIKNRPLTNVKGFGAANIESGTHISSAVAPQGRMDMLFFSKDERKELMFGLERQRMVSETKELITRRSRPAPDDCPSAEALAKEFFSRSWPSILAVLSVAMQSEHTSANVQRKCIRGLECTLMSTCALGLQTEAEATMFTLLKMGTYKSVNIECIRAVLAVASTEHSVNLTPPSWKSVVALLADGKRGVMDIAHETERLYMMLAKYSETDGPAIVRSVIDANLSALMEVSKHDAATLSTYFYVLKRCMYLLLTASTVNISEILSIWKDTVGPKILEVAKTQSESSECVTLIIDAVLKLLSVSYDRALKSNVAWKRSNQSPSPNASSPNLAQVADVPRQASTATAGEPGTAGDAKSPTSVGPTATVIAAKPFFLLVQLYQCAPTSPTLRLQLLTQLQQFVSEAEAARLGLLQQVPQEQTAPPTAGHHRSPSAVKELVPGSAPTVAHPLVAGFNDVALWRYLSQVLTLGLCDMKADTIPPFASRVTRALAHYRFPYFSDAGEASTAVGGPTPRHITAPQPLGGADGETDFLRRFQLSLAHSQAITALPAMSPLTPPENKGSFTKEEEAASLSEFESTRWEVDQFLVHLNYVSLFAKDLTVSQRSLAGLCTMASYFSSTAGDVATKVDDALERFPQRKLLTKLCIRAIFDGLRVEPDVLRRKVVEELRVLIKANKSKLMGQFLIEQLCEVCRTITLAPAAPATSVPAAPASSPMVGTPGSAPVVVQPPPGLEVSFRYLSFDRVPKTLRIVAPSQLQPLVTDLADLVILSLRTSETVVAAIPGNSGSEASRNETEEMALFVIRECALPIACASSSSVLPATRGVGAKVLAKALTCLHSSPALLAASKAFEDILNTCVIAPNLLLPHVDGAARLPSERKEDGLAPSETHRRSAQAALLHFFEDVGSRRSDHTEGRAGFADVSHLADKFYLQATIMNILGHVPMGHLCVGCWGTEFEAPFYSQLEKVLDLLLLVARSCILLESAPRLVDTSAFTQLKAKPGYLHHSVVLQKALSMHLTLLSGALKFLSSAIHSGVVKMKDHPLQQRFFTSLRDVLSLYHASVSVPAFRQDLATVIALTIDGFARAQDASSSVPSTDATSAEPHALETELDLRKAIAFHPDIFEGVARTLNPSCPSPLLLAAQHYFLAYHRLGLHPSK